jgi:hypothetical protein
MTNTLKRWLKWGIGLLGSVAELHPGVVAIGGALPPAELPRRPVREPARDLERRVEQPLPAPARAGEAGPHASFGSPGAPPYTS